MFRREYDKSKKDLQSQVTEYADVVLQLGEELKELYNASSSQDEKQINERWDAFKALREETSKKETELMPSTGSISGIYSAIAVDQIQLIIFMEDLGDSIFELGRIISKITLNELKNEQEVLEELFGLIDILIIKTCTAVKVLYDDYSAAFDLSREVDELRNSVKKQETELIVSYYEKADKIKLKEWILVSSLLKRIVEVADTAENATDYIELFALKH